MVLRINVFLHENILEKFACFREFPYMEVNCKCKLVAQVKKLYKQGQLSHQSFLMQIFSYTIAYERTLNGFCYCYDH